MKIKIDPTAESSYITDEIIILLYEGHEEKGRPDRTKFYWSIDLALKPLIAGLKDANGHYPFVSAMRKGFLQVCCACLQDVYETEIEEILFGLQISWDGADNEIELKERI